MPIHLHLLHECIIYPISLILHRTHFSFDTYKKAARSTKSKVIRRGATLVTPASTKSFHSWKEEEEEEEESGEPMQTDLSGKRLCQDLGARQTRARPSTNLPTHPFTIRGSIVFIHHAKPSLSFARENRLWNCVSSSFAYRSIHEDGSIPFRWRLFSFAAFFQPMFETVQGLRGRVGFASHLFSPCFPCWRLLLHDGRLMQVWRHEAYSSVSSTIRLRSLKVIDSLSQLKINIALLLLFFFFRRK